MTIGVSAPDPRGLLIALEEPGGAPLATGEANHFVEAVIVCRTGGVLVLGWVDDAQRPLESIRLSTAGWRVTLGAETLSRRRRPDVAESLHVSASHPHGYLGFVFGGRAIRTEGPCEVRLSFRDGGETASVIQPRVAEDIELRQTLLSHLAEPEALSSLDRGLADEIVGLNRSITDWSTANPAVERFAGPPRAYRGSIVVCLFGRAEFQFVQGALFSAVDAIEDYEFVYVSNSPELADSLVAEAHKMRRIHGIDQTLVLLPANAGFGPANNLAARRAASERLLIVNPDAFPMDHGWARRHDHLLATRPAEETRLFGAALHYADGSLMHGGMYFERDVRIGFDRSGAHRAFRTRIEHFGKGGPPDSAEATRPRPVPAVTGAFMSIDRALFERLGGFTEDYVFGHFEDADLCLKSLDSGVPAWLQDLRMWHLEGQSSPHGSAEAGARGVNQWLFERRWGAVLDQGLLGPAPTHPLLRSPG